MFSRSCRRLVTLLLLCVGYAGAQGCTFAPAFTGTTVPSGVEPASLSRLYVYSFLDLRGDQLGQTMIAEISRQLATEMDSRGIKIEQHWFKNDPIAGELARVQGTERSTERIPVREVIVRNQEKERQFGSDYRLIVFPSYTLSAGAWYHYDFRWAIEDARTQRVVWSTTSRGKHMNWVSGDENAAARARVIVQGLIGEMTRSGLLRQPSGH